MINKIIGGLLLIIGTSIGAGMLALPMVTAASGFTHSILIFLGVWAITVLGAYYILEVNLWLPEKTNMISMARATLGMPGQIITWLSYLILLYALLSAYIAGGSDLISNFLKYAFNWGAPSWASSLIFVFLFGSIVHCGIAIVDWANRGLMFLKLGTYALLVFLIAPYVEPEKLTSGQLSHITGATLVIVTAFGYATVIPSLRSYFKSNTFALRFTIGLGSIIALLLYLLWNLTVQGTIASEGENGLIKIAGSNHSVSELTEALSLGLGKPLIDRTTHWFTTICVTTSFLGVSLCLSDFLADGLKIKKEGFNRWKVTFLTLLPPLLIVLSKPGIFITALDYAGILCVILLILLPAVMIWSGRYIKKTAFGYQVWGGPWVVGSVITSSIGLLIYGLIKIS